MSISEYFEWFILYIPYQVYGWGLIAFLLVLALMMVWKGVSRGIRYAMAFLLAEYTALLLYFTVFLHRSEGVRQMVLTPFWSYRAIHQGTSILIQELAMNIAVFIPIGMMLRIIMRGVVWWKAILVGMGISVSIELLQLILMRGCCETDDVIHNTLGCLVGYGVMSIGINATRKRVEERLHCRFAGAAVVRDVPDGATVVGVPGKIIKK